MRFEEPTRWELFLDGFHNFWNCLDCYNDGGEWGYDEFWEALSYGWMQIYIWDYDDPFNRTISPERKFELVDRYNGCDVVKYTPDYSAKSAYFLNCK